MKKLEIDCRDCSNCDKENDRCRIYGSDASKAVQKCADSGFKAFWPIEAAQAGEGGQDEDR